MANTLVVEMVPDKLTKNTVRFAEVEEGTAIRTLYIQKDQLRELDGTFPPKKIVVKVTVE